MIRPILKRLAVSVLVLLPALAGGEGRTAPAATPPALKKLSIQQVSDLLEKRHDLHLFDVNGPERYAAGHLPGAIWLRFDTVEAGNLPPDEGATLVFYCASERCSACHVAARSALALGYRNVFIMPAGIMGWEKAGKPVEKRGRSRS
jgi:rhodanese-related sulfurtransferase